jgi:nitroreductase
MNFIDLISKRYSVRAYKDTPVEEEKLLQVLEAARLAPTAANRQPFKLIVIRTQGREDQLRKIYNRDWFVGAPIVICAVGTPKTAWTRNDDTKYTQTDVAIAMDHLILQATELGLGTCWIAAFNPKAARKVLELPKKVDPLIFTPLGYPADELKVKVRKNLSELVQYERWS